MRVTINITPDDVQAALTDITKAPKELPESYSLLQQIILSVRQEATYQHDEIETISSMLDQNYFLGCSAIDDSELYESDEESDEVTK